MDWNENSFNTIKAWEIDWLVNEYMAKINIHHLTALDAFNKDINDNFEKLYGLYRLRH